MGRPLDEDIIIKILERWQKAFKENSHYVSASDLSLVIKDVRELPTIQSVATDTNVGDTISRQAAIDAINSWRGRFSEEYNEAIDNCENSIIELPPVQPERKKGEWSDGYRWQRCSLCKQTGKKSWNYCPNCGACMKGEQQK